MSALAELLVRPAWHRDALCREPEYAGLPWFPRRGETPAAAKAVCRRCLVRAECAGAVARYDATTDRSPTVGVWAGTTGTERRNARSVAYQAARAREQAAA